MPRQARKVSASGVHHCIWRGIDQVRIFRDDLDYLEFLKILGETQEKETFEILAYSLMSNHIHLLVKTTKGNNSELESASKRIGVRYSGYFNRRYNRTGHVFQDRFKSVPVENIPYFLRCFRYIHNNPVNARIVETAAQYRWSSYTQYFGESETSYLCTINTDYVFMLKSKEWLEEFHREKEFNLCSFSASEAHPVDCQAVKIIQCVAQCEPHLLQNLSTEKQEKVLKKLVYQERLRVPQISRLTGLDKGLIQRLIN